MTHLKKQKLFQHWASQQCGATALPQFLELPKYLTQHHANRLNDAKAYLAHMYNE